MAAKSWYMIAKMQICQFMCLGIASILIRQTILTASAYTYDTKSDVLPPECASFVDLFSANAASVHPNPLFRKTGKSLLKSWLLNGKVESDPLNPSSFYNFYMQPTNSESTIATWWYVFENDVMNVFHGMLVRCLLHLYS